ncbi:MAG: glycerate kinase [Clostridiaceae bacterium]|nr:glycerate kinase [Clostridiaceae bacterium]
MNVREDAYKIINNAIADAMPDVAVKSFLQGLDIQKEILLVSIGKAGYQMAKSAYEVLEYRIGKGIVITKYGHSSGNIGPIVVYEAGHPVLDENSVKATEAVLEMVRGLNEDYVVIFLVSGGGSALFESPLIPLAELQDINRQLLACGANIVEVNTIRKRLSSVKGGRFAEACAPADVISIILSDIVGDPLDMIASGPAYPDKSTRSEAAEIVRKYGLKLSENALKCIASETPKTLSNVKTYVTGSVNQLCTSAAVTAESMGYQTVILTSSLDCEAKEAGKMLSAIARYHNNDNKALAFIAGGETVVRLTGKGMGGRNQELALSAAEGISGLSNVCIFSVGSDGTDGPTDAAGGIVDGNTANILKQQGLSINAVLADNDSYNALKECGGLVITGPTGTNVNDFCVVLKGKKTK